MKACSIEKSGCYSHSRMLIWVRIVSYVEGIDDLGMVGHLADGISPLAIFHAQDIKTNPCIVAQIFLKVE